MKCLLCFNIKSTPRLAKNTDVVVAESGADRLVKIFEQCDVPWRDSKWRDSVTYIGMYFLLVSWQFCGWKKHVVSWQTIFLADFLFEFDASTGLSSVNTDELCGNAEKWCLHTSFCFNQSLGWYVSCLKWSFVAPLANFLCHGMNISTQIPILTHLNLTTDRKCLIPSPVNVFHSCFLMFFSIGLKGIVSYVDFDPSILCRTGMV